MEPRPCCPARTPPRPRPLAAAAAQAGSAQVKRRPAALRCCNQQRSLGSESTNWPPAQALPRALHPGQPARMLQHRQSPAPQASSQERASSSQYREPSNQPSSRRRQSSQPASQRRQSSMTPQWGQGGPRSTPGPPVRPLARRLCPAPLYSLPQARQAPCRHSRTPELPKPRRRSSCKAMPPVPPGLRRICCVPQARQWSRRRPHQFSRRRPPTALERARVQQSQASGIAAKAAAIAAHHRRTMRGAPRVHAINHINKYMNM
jgi:hypothetical protein